MKSEYDQAGLTYDLGGVKVERLSEGVMAAKLTFQYDRQGDILYITSCPPYAEQATEELGDDVIARLNPDTGDVESLEILSFSTRLQDDQFELPVTAALRRAG